MLLVKRNSIAYHFSHKTKFGSELQVLVEIFSQVVGIPRSENFFSFRVLQVARTPPG